jgi:hypothetical protein
VSIAWVTSFSNDLYEATGKSLVSSFESTLPDGKLFIAPERVPALSFKAYGKISLLADPADSADLATVIATNREVIPVELGGLWTGPCSCPHPLNPKDTKHKPGCPSSWFCKYFVRWFRKVLALKSFCKGSYLGFSHVFWLDSDVVFKKKITVADVHKWFKGNDLVYFKGPKRKVWETGVIGFNTNALPVIDAVSKYYTSGDFRKSYRWDDSYGFQTIASRLKTINKIDLATGASANADVIPHSPLADYIEHNKGTHGRKLGLMT